MNRLRRFVDARLQPPYLSVAAGAIVAVSLVLVVTLFFTSNRGRTAFGIPLGADFSGFYVAAEILDRGEPQQLYDRELHHRLYHELLPNEDPRESIPYVHPPFVAGFLRPLAWLPYETAVGIWLVISASLYIAAMILFLESIPWPEKKQSVESAAGSHRYSIARRALEQYGFVVLLAVSFEPFAFECWLGGQLSAIAFCSYALCFAARQRGKPLLAGTALGLCFYKPTLLLLTLPMLVIGRRWQMLLGMTITGAALAMASLLLVGWDVNIGYLDVLLSFRKSTSEGDLEIRTWKYVDLNNCLRLLLGGGSPFQLPLLAIVGVLPFVFLARFWWKWDRLDEDQRTTLWAATITWTPVLNLYFGIYDSILIVQSVLMTVASLCLRSKSETPLTNSGVAYLLLLIYLVPWFSQILARMTGVPLYTLLLMGLGSYQFGRLLVARQKMRQECINLCKEKPHAQRTIND